MARGTSVFCRNDDLSGEEQNKLSRTNILDRLDLVAVVLDCVRLMAISYDSLFESIATLVMHHSPSGVEGEIDQFLLECFAALGIECWLDEAGNLIAKIPGKNPDRAIAITAHKDEIGGIVKTIHPRWGR